MSDAEDQHYPQDPKLGDLLREARQEKGLELGDVAGLTNVRREYLEALEAGRYAELPEDVYTRNFLKLFAQAVGFDVVRAQEMYRSERREAHAFDTSEQRLERDREIAATVPPASGRWWETPGDGPRWGPLVSTALMVVAVVALALWGFNSTFFDASRGLPEGTTEAEDQLAETASPAVEEDREAVIDGTPVAELPRTVRLSVTSTPSGAEVLVDGFPLPGVTPIESAPVTARPARTIRLEREGYVPYEEEFDLSRDRHLSFFLTPVSAVRTEEGAEANPAAPGDPDTAEAAGGQEGEVTLTITEDTWLEVYSGTSRSGGERLAFMTARAGQTLSYPLPVYIHVGNAGGVELTVEGQERGTLGSSGEVRGLAVTD